VGIKNDGNVENNYYGKKVRSLVFLRYVFTRLWTEGLCGFKSGGRWKFHVYVDRQSAFWRGVRQTSASTRV